MQNINLCWCVAIIKVIWYILIPQPCLYIMKRKQIVIFRYLKLESCLLLSVCKLHKNHFAFAERIKLPSYSFFQSCFLDPVNYSFLECLAYGAWSGHGSVETRPHPGVDGQFRLGPLLFILGGKTHSVALKHGVLLSLSSKDKCPHVNLLTCRVTMQFFVLLTMFIHLWKKEYGKIYMISDAGHHFTQAAPITPFLGTENIILGIITGGILPWKRWLIQDVSFW